MSETDAAVRTVLYRFRQNQIEVFLGQRPDWSNLAADEWQLPGGSMEDDDPSPIAGNIRELIQELKEFSETDVVRLEEALIELGEYIDPESEWLTHAFILHIADVLETYELHLSERELREGMTEAGWFTKEQLETIAVAFNHPEIIEDFFDWMEKEINSQL